MLTRRELAVSAVAFLVSCATAPEQVAEPEVPSGPLYFDLHIDTPARLVSEGLNLAESHEYTSVDIPKMKQGGMNAGFFAVSTPARSQTPLEAVKKALEITDVIVKEVKRHPSDLFLATTSEDVLRAQREGMIGVLIGMTHGY